MSETFYELLGVSTDASADEIERAYRDLVTEVHPDVTDDPDASERFQRLTRARGVLTDPAERRRYDRLGHASSTNPSSDLPSGGTPALRQARSRDLRRGGRRRLDRRAGRNRGKGYRRFGSPGPEVDS